MKKHLYKLGISLIFSIGCLVFSTPSLKAQLNCEFTCDSIFARFDAMHQVGTGGLFYPLILRYKSSVRKCNNIIEIKIDSMSIEDLTSGS